MFNEVGVNSLSHPKFNSIINHDPVICFFFRHFDSPKWLIKEVHASWFGVVITISFGMKRGWLSLNRDFPFSDHPFPIS